MSQLRKVDHIAYACEKGSIEKWAWFHIEVEGGTLINRIDDIRPDDPDSSMKIWCIDFGDFGVALIEGIDRNRKSQVTKYVERHGDHSCQHVAYDCYDLEAFQSRLGRFGGRARGDTLVRNDGFGLLKQMFAKGYAAGDAAETGFPEYLERPRRRHATGSVQMTFSSQAGRGFYEQIETAIETGDTEPFFDFSKMPADWQVPEPRPAVDAASRGTTARAARSVSERVAELDTEIG